MPPKYVVLMNPYEVQLAVESPLTVLTPDEAQKLVISLIAAIRTITLPCKGDMVVH